MKIYIKNLVCVIIEVLSSCKHGRITEALTWSRLGIMHLFYIARNILLKKREECSLCKWAGHSYFPYYSGSGKDIRNEEICPRCYALERQRNMAIFLSDEISQYNKIDILYVAPHPAMLKYFSRFSNVNLITIDLESPLAMKKMDLHHLEFSDESFDVVICSHVLEHVRDDIHCMKELHRVLKHGHLALLPVPLNYGLEESIEYDTPDPDQYEHVREYGKDYFKRLESVGLMLLAEWEFTMAVRKRV